MAQLSGRAHGCGGFPCGVKRVEKVICAKHSGIWESQTPWGIQNQPTIKFIYMYELPAQAYVQAVADFEHLQSAGKIKHLPVREFSLSEIAQVHEAVEKGNSGTRMVIVMPA